MTKITLRQLVLTSACIFTCSPAWAGADNTTDIERMRAQLDAMSARLDELERANHALSQAHAELQARGDAQRAASNEAHVRFETALEESHEQSQAASWADTISWKGDFRYRFEHFDVDGKDERNRSRIRARAQLGARINDQMEVGIGVASGSEDPVSSNQTLGNAGSSKDLRLDLAYFKWTGLQDTQVVGGKFKNILEPAGKNSMLWDSDWRPEGTAIAWDNGTFFAHGLGTWLESDSNKGNHFAWIAAAGVNLALGERTDLRLGLGYHEFDTAGRPSVFGDGAFFGNSSASIAGTPVYQHDYHGLQAFGELTFGIGQLPVTAFADYVQNQEADDFDTGYIFGLKLGSAKKPGSWDLSWAWEDLEADAALGLLADSDFGGGGTDARGHIFKGSYVLRKNVSAKFTYFLNEIDGDLGSEKDFDRLMLDLSMKF